MIKLISLLIATTIFISCESKKEGKEDETKKFGELNTTLLSEELSKILDSRFYGADELFCEATYKERLSEYLLFGQLMDQRRIEQNIPIIQPDSLYSNLDTTTLYQKLLSSAKLINQKRLYEAKIILKEIVNSKPNDSQVTLCAWNDLRNLGEQPTKAELEGIIFEIPLNNAFGYLSIYKDKSAEYKYIEYINDFSSSKKLRILRFDYGYNS